MKKVILILALALASCNEPVGKDGYSFGKKEYEKPIVQVGIVTYKSSSDLQKFIKTKYNLNGSNNVAAFSVLRPDICVIHMVDPSVKYEPEFVGHEFLHCVYGQWHTNNDSRS